MSTKALDKTQAAADAADLALLANASKELGVSFPSAQGKDKSAADDDGDDDQKSDDDDDQSQDDEDDKSSDDDDDQKSSGDDDDQDDDDEESSDDDDEESGEEDDQDDENQDDDEDAGSEDDDDQKSDEDDDKQDDEDPAKGYKDHAAGVVAAKLKHLPKEHRKLAQEIINSQIGRVVARERSERDRLGSRVEQLTQEVETLAKQKGPTQVAGVNPVLLADSEDDITAREEEIERFERWAAKHANGVNLPDSEGYDPSKPTYTAEQIEARLDAVLQEKKRILPLARQNLQSRAEFDKALRKVYPAVFDPKSAEYAQVQQVLKVLPQLKQFPDFRVLALKQILGARALAELVKSKKESSPTGRDRQQQREHKPRKPAPRGPGGGGSPAKGGAFDRKSSKPAASKAVEKFTAGESSLQDAVSALIPNL